MSPAEAIADPGLHAALAIGPRCRLTPEQIRELSAYECDLLCDGELVTHGFGVDVLGGPLQALAWLLRLLPDGVDPVSWTPSGLTAIVSDITSWAAA